MSSRTASYRAGRHDHAQAEDVAAAIDPVPFATGLFGTHVGRRARVLWSLADVLFPQSQTKIDDEWLAVFPDQNVARLHVPMHKPLFVGVVQGFRDRRHQFGRFPVLEPLLLDLRREINTFDVLRDHVAGTVAGTVFRAADIEYGDDVRMIELGDCPRLGQIRFRIFGLGDQLSVWHFDGNQSLQMLIIGEIDKAEAPFAEDFLDAIATGPLGVFSGPSISLLERISSQVLCHIVRVRVAHVSNWFGERWSSLAKRCDSGDYNRIAFRNPYSHGFGFAVGTWRQLAHASRAFRTGGRRLLPELHIVSADPAPFQLWPKPRTEEAGKPRATKPIRPKKTANRPIQRLGK